MPRKKWVPKNDFCRHSKLDNSEFGTLVQYYFREVLFGEPRDSCYLDFIVTCHFNDKMTFAPNIKYDDNLRIKHTFTSFINDTDKETVKSLRDSLDFKKKPISKESFNSNFNRMGKYIWDRFIINLHPLFREEDVFDELIYLIHNKTNEIASYHELFYGFLSGFPLYLTEDKIFQSRLFHLLSRRSKVTRGFKKETFYLESARVYFICEVIKKYKIKLRLVKSTEEVDKMDQVVFEATMYFLSKLLEDPM